MKNILKAVVVLAFFVMSGLIIFHFAIGGEAPYTVLYNSLFGQITSRDVMVKRWDDRPAEKMTLISRDSQAVAYSPRMVELDIPPILIAALQPNKRGICVMVAAPEFSFAPRAFLALDFVSELEFVAPDMMRAEQVLSEEFRALPQFNRDERDGRLTLTKANPRSYIESTHKYYDLIFIEQPLPYSISGNRFYTYDFFTAVSKRLEPNGAFAMLLRDPAGYSENAITEFNGIISATLRRIFKRIEFIRKDGLTLIIAGNTQHITRNIHMLDYRAATLTPPFKSVLPELLITVLYSDYVMEQDSQKINAATVNSPMNFDRSPELPTTLWQKHPSVRIGLCDWVAKAYDFCRFHYILILAVSLILYLVLRYFISWKPMHRVAFHLFENGIFTGGVATILFFMFQTRLGTGYMMFPLGIMTLFLGILSAFLLRNKTTGSVLKWISSLLPLSALMFTSFSAFVPMIIFFPLLLLCGLSGGLIHQEYMKRSWSIEEKLLLPAVECIGLMTGITVTCCFVTSLGGFVFLSILFFVIRLIRAVAEK